MGLKSKLKKYWLHTSMPITSYVPELIKKPEKIIPVVTAWEGIELIIEDILKRFEIDNNSCIEFGVEFGYSSVVLSNYFEKVIGVDTFSGDSHTDFKEDHFESTKNRLSNFKNIELIKSDYRDWIKQDENIYDFSHIDIVHNYKETYECGLWAVNHSKCTIFHDTESFSNVRKAVIDIAKHTNKKLFNYPYCHGLGIII